MFLIQYAIKVGLQASISMIEFNIPEPTLNFKQSVKQSGSFRFVTKFTKLSELEFNG